MHRGGHCILPRRSGLNHYDIRTYYSARSLLNMTKEVLNFNSHSWDRSSHSCLLILSGTWASCAKTKQDQYIPTSRRGFFPPVIKEVHVSRLVVHGFLANTSWSRSKATSLHWITMWKISFSEQRRKDREQNGANQSFQSKKINPIGITVTAKSH